MISGYHGRRRPLLVRGQGAARPLWAAITAQGPRPADETLRPGARSRETGPGWRRPARAGSCRPAPNAPSTRPAPPKGRPRPSSETPATARQANPAAARPMRRSRPRRRRRTTAATRGPKSLPLSSPPSSSQTGPAEVASAANAASGVVDFESSTICRPATGASAWQRCARPRNRVSARSIAGPATPQCSAAAAASAALRRLCSPGSSSGARRSSGQAGTNFPRIPRVQESTSASVGSTTANPPAGSSSRARRFAAT